MLVGVVSDTHDHLDNVEKAINIFKNEGVKLIIHCGDIISPFCLDLFNNCSIDWIGVLGNNDGEVEILLKRAGNRLSKEPREEEIDGYKILIKHYHFFTEEIALSSKFDFIFFGHTHVPKAENINGTLIVNPGECCGWVTKKPTIAIVDLKTKKSDIIPL